MHEINHFNQNLITKTRSSMDLTFPTIPIEIWDMICSHINLIDYHQLRLSTRYISLPQRQTVTWESYLDSLNYVDNYSLLNTNLLLNLEFICGDRVLQLFENKQYKAVKGALIKHQQKISFEYMQKILWKSLLEGMPDLTLLILTDETIDIDYDDNLGDALNQLGYFDNYLGSTYLKPGHLESMLLLLNDKRFTPSNFSDIADWTIFWSCSMGNKAIFESLLSCDRVDTTSIDDDCLVEACRNGHATMVDVLLAIPNIDPTSFNYRALYLASIYGHYDVVDRLLVSPRVKSQANLRMAAQYAIQSDHWSAFGRISKSLTTKNFLSVLKSSDTVQKYGTIFTIILFLGVITVEFLCPKYSTSYKIVGIAAGIPCAGVGLLFADMHKLRRPSDYSYIEEMFTLFK